MPKIATRSFRIYNAKQFINSLNPINNRKLYLFIARARPWDDDLSPPTPTDSSDHFRTWEDIIALKRINFADVKHVIPRVEWTAGIIVDEYDDLDFDLFNKNYFVKNSENNVYKCISNNYGSISTQEPRGKSFNYFLTADSYKWKYMYSIDDNDRLRFETRDYMPVNLNTDVAYYAKNGSLENVKILTLGSNYTNVANLTVNVVGNGSNANIVPIVSSANSIVGYTVNNPGVNYTYANLFVIGGGGSGANARLVVSPYGGHGKDSIEELGGYRVLINSRIDFAEGSGDFPISNDFRTIGLIEAPIDANTLLEAELLTYDATNTLNVAPLSGIFLPDEFILGSVSKANAQIISTGTGARFDVKYIQNRDISNGFISFRVGDTITGSSSAATAYVHSIKNSEVVKNTGKILFYENRGKISRAADQSENIHIVIEF